MEYECLSEADKVYSDGEFANFDEKVKAALMDRYMDDIVSNNREVPSRANLDKRVKSGE